jgi:hypothetical protein
MTLPLPMDEQQRVPLFQSIQLSYQHKLPSLPKQHRAPPLDEPSTRYPRRDQRMPQRRGDESCRRLPLHQKSQTCSPMTFNVYLPSAGVPNKITFPPNLFFIITSAAASAAPTDATAIKLCPQACPSPVKASTSQSAHQPHLSTIIIHPLLDQKSKLTILSIKRNHTPRPPALKNSHKRRSNPISRRRYFPPLTLVFLLADELREGFVRDEFFVADFRIVVDCEAEVAE